MSKQNQASHHSRPRPWLAALLLAACLPCARGLHAGAVEEIIDITGYRPSVVPGEFIAKVVPIHWDSRCMPVLLQVNDTLDPIPNPLGSPFLSVAQATAALQAAADVWSSVPTSSARVRIAGVTHNAGAATLDFINEVTFRTPEGFPPSNQSTTYSIDFGAISTVRFTRLIADFDFTDGLDINGDGVPDVSAALAHCQLVDGQIKFPAGTYKAGTIVDADIIFNTGATTTGTGTDGFRFTVDPAAIGSHPRSLDLFSMAVQAIGSLLGVAHSRTNQRSEHDGRGATMFPYVDTADAADQAALRRLDVDAVTSLSTLYPKGAAFKDAFGFISGEIRLGARDEPLLGASVSALDEESGAIVNTAISGTSQLSVSHDGLRGTFVGASFNAIDGKYTLAVPPGSYRVRVDPIRDDRTPIRYFNVNLQSQLTHFIAQNDFEEKFYRRRGEEDDGRAAAEATVVQVRAGQTIRGIDIVTDRTVKIANFGPFDHRGFAGAAPGTWYAVRIPPDQLLAAVAAAGSDAVISSAGFLTASEDASVVPRFAEALLTTGRVEADGTAVVELERPLALRRDFVGRDTDFAPFPLAHPEEVTRQVRQGIARGTITDLFLVLRLPAEGRFPGVHHAAPEIGLDGGSPAFGLSYSSTDGKVFTPAAGVNYMFKLVLAAVP